MRLTHLKIKIKSLGEEQKIIRREERKVKQDRPIERRARRLFAQWWAETRMEQAKVVAAGGGASGPEIIRQWDEAKVDNQKLQAHARSLLKVAKRDLRKDWPMDAAALHELQVHRVREIRPLLRLNQLAYACLRGTPYEACEKSCKIAPKWDEIKKIALRFGGTEEQIAEWMHPALQPAYFAILFPTVKATEPAHAP